MTTGLSRLSPEPQLYFNHIPKTAGTSLRNALERVFPASAHNKYWFADEYLRDTDRHLNAHSLLCGHFGMIPPAMSSRPYRMMTFLREPDARAFSHFLHLKTDPASPWRHVVQDMTYEDFLFSPAAEPELLSFQSRHLGLVSPRDYFDVKDIQFDRRWLTDRYRSKALLATACATLDNTWFVGVTERYAESMQRLSSMLRVPLDGDARLNIARVRHEVPTLSPAAQSRLNWLNEFDHVIYAKAQELIANDPVRPEAYLPDDSFFKTHVDFQSGFVGGGWHPVEARDGRGYCWSSVPAPWLAFLAKWQGDSLFCARVATWISSDLAELEVWVNGARISIDFALAADADGTNFMYVTGLIPSDLSGPHGMLKVELRLPRTVKPCEVSLDSDDRALGLYANWVRVLPASGYTGR